LLVGPGLVVLGGCGGGEAGPTKAWATIETEHFRLHTSADDSLGCLTYAEQAERQIVDLWEFLEVPTVLRGRAEFYQLTAQELAEGASPCALQEGLLGCSLGAVGYGVPSSLQHELVHAALNGVGLPPPLFSEGLAVAVTCAPDPGLTLGVPRGDWRTYLNDVKHTGFASLLVTHLLDEHGPAPLLQLYASTPYEASESEVAQSFLSAYGTSLDDAWDSALQAARSCLALTACQARVLDGTALLGRGCDSQLGYRLPRFPAQVAVTGPGMLLRACQNHAPSGFPSLTPAAPVWLSPSDGEYAVQYDDDWPRTELAVTPVAGALTSSCSETMPIAATGAFAQRALLTPQAAPLFVELQADDPIAMVGREYSGSSNLSYSWNVETCLGCEAGQGVDCEPAGTEHQGRFWMKFTWGEPFVPEVFAVELHPL